MVFTAFFVGACVCLGLSTCFHTFLCHSEWVGQLFSKLDYVGIALLIMGSFVPWLYYSFYCDFVSRITYLSVEIVLGVTSIVVSLWPRFGEPKFRFLRAGNHQHTNSMKVLKTKLVCRCIFEFWSQWSGTCSSLLSCRGMVESSEPSFLGLAHSHGSLICHGHHVLCPSHT